MSQSVILAGARTRIGELKGSLAACAAQLGSDAITAAVACTGPPIAASDLLEINEAYAAVAVASIDDRKAPGEMR